jgi:antitoxin MazE
VATGEAMKIAIRRMGNSQGVVIPKPILAQLGLEDRVDMTVENDSIVLRRSARTVTAGWAEASKAIAAAGDDKLVMGEFPNRKMRSSYDRQKDVS